MNGFWFYNNWFESIKDLASGDERDKINALELTLALCQYGMTGEVPEGMSPTVSSNFRTMQVGMDSSKRRYEKNVEDGKKGGRPSGKKDLALALIEEGLGKEEILRRGISESTYKRAKREFLDQKVEGTGQNLGQNSSEQDDFSRGQKGSKVGQNDFDLERVKSSKGGQNSFDPKAQINGYVF